MEPRDVDKIKLGKRSYSQQGIDLFGNKKQRKDKEFADAEKNPNVNIVPPSVCMYFE